MNETRAYSIPGIPSAVVTVLCFFACGALFFGGGAPPSSRAT